jgi:hypothetical protein
MGTIRNAHDILVDKLEGRENLEDLGGDGKMILEWLLGKLHGRVWTGCIWLRIGITGWPVRKR